MTGHHGLPPQPPQGGQCVVELLCGERRLRSKTLPCSGCKMLPAVQGESMNTSMANDITVTVGISCNHMAHFGWAGDLRVTGDVLEAAEPLVMHCHAKWIARPWTTQVPDLRPSQ